MLHILLIQLCASNNNLYQSAEGRDEFTTMSERQSRAKRESEIRTALDRLEGIEKSSWRNTLRWVTVDKTFERFLYFLSINRESITQENQAARKFSPFSVRMSGGSFPMASEYNRNLVSFINGLRAGLELTIFRSIQLAVLAIPSEQIIRLMIQTPPLPCQKPEITFSDVLLTFYGQSSNNEFLKILRDTIGAQNSALSYFRFAMALPVIVGLGKGAWNIRNNNLSTQEIESSLEKLSAVDPSFYNDIFRWLFPFHTIGSEMDNLMKNVLWNANTDADDLNKIFAALESMTTHERGYTSIYALGHLMSLAHSLNSRDQEKFLRSQDMAGKDTDQLLPRQTQATPESINPHLALKAKALIALQRACSFYQQQPFGGDQDFSIQEFPEDPKLKSLVGCAIALYSRYVLWALGDSPSWGESVLYPILKGGKLFVQANFLHSIISAFLTAHPTAPDKKKKQFLPQKCFDEFVRIFNTIPGQPTSSLVGNLDEYCFPNRTVSLDLSNKNLPWEAIYNITLALFNHNITIDRADFSHNVLTYVDPILELLEGTTTLDLSNNCGQEASGHKFIQTVNFTKLPRSLTFLNLACNNIGSDGMKVDFAELPKFLSHLDLSMNQIGFNGMEVDFAGLPPFLAYLSLYGNPLWSATGIKLDDLPKSLVSLDLGANPVIDQTGIVENFTWLANFTSLTSLSLYHNRLESNGTIAGFSKLPKSIKNLNLEYNDIGSVDFTELPASMTSLDFHGCDIVFDSADFKKLPRNLSYLGLSDIQLGSNGQAADLTELPPSLLNLYLGPTKIGSGSVIKLTGLPETISWMGFGDDYLIGLNGIANFTGLPIFLKGLSFLANHMGYDGAVVNFTGLPASLTFIFIEDNPLGSNGAVAFSGLPASLAMLSLSETQIGASGAKVDFKGLPESLTRFQIMESEIGSVSPEVHFTGVPSSLLNLVLSYNSIGSKGMANFTGLPISLTAIDLSFNRIDDRSVPGLIQMISPLRNLKTINLTDNTIGSTGPEGPATLLAALLDLPHLDWNTLHVNGMTNISWSSTANETHNKRSEAVLAICQPATSSAYKPSPFLIDSVRGVSTGLSEIYQTLWQVYENPEVQRIGWTVLASKLAYATFQTWPLLATYAALS